MNILQDIDATLHYENVEKAWKKYKFHFVFALIALFGGIAAFNAYNMKVMTDSKNDTSVIFQIMRENMQAKNPTEVILASMDELVTPQGKEMLTLELAKAYNTEGKTEDYEKTLIELTNAKTEAIRSISVYMLAELYLGQKPTKALEFINNTKLSKNNVAYSLVEEIKAMALSYEGKNDEAKAIYTTLIGDENTPAGQKDRLQIKLNQLG
jgi:predicted negative regulator of RcsB-dependent stress response